nr:hypothetical protein [Micromonospora sp. DSM 115978]
MRGSPQSCGRCCHTRRPAPDSTPRTSARPTSQEWRDRVDDIPEDHTIREATDARYRYLPIDTTDLDVAATVHRIRDAIPDIYRG